MNLTLQDKGMKLQTELALHHKTGLLLRNPVMIAAGTFGYGIEYAKLAEVQRLGAIISKSTALRPYRGNPHLRIVETPSGLLHLILLQKP
jgi:dihydroorotate dehydrogenase (NAD+) catalytic subunit